MKRKLGAILLVVSLVLAFGAIPAYAAPPTMPPPGEHFTFNTVTKLSTLFSDAFDDGDAVGWTTVGSGGTWGVEDDIDFGSLVYSQEDTTWTTTSTYDTYWRSYGGESWTNYSVEAKVKIVSGGFAPIAGIFFRVQGTDLSSGYYMFRIDARADTGPALIKSPNTILAGGHSTFPQYVNEPATIGQIYNLKVIVNGNNIQCYVDGVKKIDYMDVSNPYLSGGIGLGSFNAHVHFDDVNVSGLKPGEILVPLNGSGMLGFKTGPTFKILDNDMTDGQAWVQVPVGSYVTYDQARGKPGGNLTWGNYHARVTKKPVWVEHNGPGGLNWSGTGVINWPFTNNGVTCYSFRLYPNP